MRRRILENRVGGEEVAYPEVPWCEVPLGKFYYITMRSGKIVIDGINLNDGAIVLHRQCGEGIRRCFDCVSKAGLIW